MVDILPPAEIRIYSTPGHPDYHSQPCGGCGLMDCGPCETRRATRTYPPAVAPEPWPADPPHPAQPEESEHDDTD